MMNFDIQLSPKVIEDPSDDSDALLQAKITSITHGELTPGGDPAALLIFEFRLINMQDSRRFIHYNISVTIGAAGGDVTLQPKIFKVAPAGLFTLNKPSLVKKTTHTTAKKLSGKASAFSANMGFEWKMRERKEGDSGMARLSGTKRSRGVGRGNDVAAWSILEDIKGGGVPTFLRTAMLLHRKTDAPFSLLIEVVSDVDFVSLEPRFRDLFGWSDAKVDPQSVRMETLDPIKVDVTNMSKLDLSKYILDTMTEAQQETSSTYATPEAKGKKINPEALVSNRQQSEEYPWEYSLQSGFLELCEPLQDAFAPYLKDGVFRRQAEEMTKIFQSNMKLRQEKALDFLRSLAFTTGTDDATQGTSYNDALKVEIENLHIPEPLQKYSIPYLENETNRGLVVKRIAEFRSNTQLRQNSALDLLHVLGLEEETGNRGQNLSKGAEEESNHPNDEHVPTSEGDTRSDPGEKASQQNTLLTATERQPQPRNIDPKFFDWANLWAHELEPTDDIMQKKYLATLALYETVKVNVKTQGIGIGLEGLVKLIRHWFHKDDLLPYFRSVEREILLPAKDLEEENQKQQLGNLDTNLFDLSKFAGFDTRLTSVTYGGSNYGTITLFELTGAAEGVPTAIRPLAAMRKVPRIIIEKMGQGITGSTKTSLAMPSHKVWDDTEQKKTGRLKPISSKPSLLNHGSHSVGIRLRIALSMDRQDTPWSKFVATIPQMVTMLHHKTDIIEKIESTSVHVEEEAEEPWVQMELGPRVNGHEYNTPRVQIIVLAPALGKWVDELFMWR